MHLDALTLVLAWLPTIDRALMLWYFRTSEHRAAIVHAGPWVIDSITVLRIIYDAEAWEEVFPYIVEAVVDVNSIRYYATYDRPIPALRKLTLVGIEICPAVLGAHWLGRVEHLIITMGSRNYFFRCLPPRVRTLEIEGSGFVRVAHSASTVRRLVARHINVGVRVKEYPHLVDLTLHVDRIRARCDDINAHPTLKRLRVAGIRRCESYRGPFPREVLPNIRPGIRMLFADDADPELDPTAVERRRPSD